MARVQTEGPRQVLPRTLLPGSNQLSETGAEAGENDDLCSYYVKFGATKVKYILQLCKYNVHFYLLADIVRRLDPEFMM